MPPVVRVRPAARPQVSSRSACHVRALQNIRMDVRFPVEGTLPGGMGEMEMMWSGDRLSTIHPDAKGGSQAAFCYVKDASDLVETGRSNAASCGLLATFSLGQGGVHSRESGGVQHHQPAVTAFLSDLQSLRHTTRQRCCWKAPDGKARPEANVDPGFTTTN